MTQKKSIVILAHNIRSLWNVGSFFRTADAFGIDHVYLTGYTGTPPRTEISKTALHADEWIPWSHHEGPLTVIAKLRKKGYSIIALEQTKQSISLKSFSAPAKMCLILGHEVLGVSKELLKESDATIHIPMYGKKESLNVAVATGIALYGLKEAA